MIGRKVLSVDRGILAAIGSGLLYALAQPNWGVWPLAAVCMIPLFRELAGAPLRRRLWLAYVFGSVAAGVATAVSGAVGAVAYFGLPVWAGGLAALAAGQVFGAGSYLLFALLAGDPARHTPLTAALRVGAAWAASELVRSLALTGLPWLLFAYTLVPVPELAQAASLGGVLFVSLWLAALNAALARATLRRAAGAMAWRSALVAPVAISAVALAFNFAGSPSDAFEDAASTPSLRVLIVQAAVPNKWRGNSPGARLALDQLVELSRVEPVPDLVLWPENAVSALLPLNGQLLSAALSRLERAAPHLIVGAPRADPEVPGRMLTSAFLVGPERQLLGHHDKVHLLPFAEYVPWPLSLLAHGGSRTSAGRSPTVLHAGDVGVGPLLCYEVLFAELGRELVRGGAQILVNLSNDAWFGTTGAVEQHLAGAVFRAIETRRPVLRSTNTGITAAIDARGVIVGRLEMNRPGALAVDVRPGRELTAYVRAGNVVGWGALALTVAISLGEAVGSRRARAAAGRVGPLRSSGG